MSSLVLRTVSSNGGVITRSTAYAIASLARTLPVSAYSLDRDGDDEEDDDGEAEDDSNEDGEAAAQTDGNNVTFGNPREPDGHYVASGQKGTQNPLPTMDELEELASQFGERLTQFGVQTRVWQVRQLGTGISGFTGC